MKVSNNRPLIIFGSGKIATVITEYLRLESNTKVVAYTCESEFVHNNCHLGLPLIPFDEIEARYSPLTHDLHIAVGYHQLNQVRARLYWEAKAKGYHLPSFISSRSWPGGGLNCGENCFIADGVSVEPGACIGNNVALWSNVVIGHHATIHDHCWLAAGTVIGGGSTIGERCFAALNVTVGNEVTVGADSILGARSLVTKSQPENSVLIERDTERFRLDSTQFLRMSKLR